MSQNSLVVANGAGAAVRSALNNALNSLVTNNSGTGGPATTYAYMLWADTTTGLLKIRNAANSAWITIGTMATANLGHALTTTTGLPGTLAAGTTAQLNPYAVNVKTTTAHGLGAVPTFVNIYLECLTAELGYAIGDRLYHGGFQSTAVTGAGYLVQIDATNIVIIAAQGLIAVNKTTPSSAIGLTAANWRIVVIPYKIS